MTDAARARAIVFVRELFGPPTGQEIYDPPLSDNVLRLVAELERKAPQKPRRRKSLPSPLTPEARKPAE
jgi:hypothetical protein